MLYNVFFFLRYESFLILQNNWQYTKIYTRQYTKIPLGKIFQNHRKVQPKEFYWTKDLTHNLDNVLHDYMTARVSG